MSGADVEPFALVDGQRVELFPPDLDVQELAVGIGQVDFDERAGGAGVSQRGPQPAADVLARDVELMRPRVALGMGRSVGRRRVIHDDRPEQGLA